jgi:hypothetical protein
VKGGQPRRSLLEAGEFTFVAARVFGAADNQPGSGRPQCHMLVRPGDLADLGVVCGSPSCSTTGLQAGFGNAAIAASSASVTMSHLSRCGP